MVLQQLVCLSTIFLGLFLFSTCISPTTSLPQAFLAGDLSFTRKTGQDAVFLKQNRNGCKLDGTHPNGQLKPATDLFEDPCKMVTFISDGGAHDSYSFCS